MQFYLSHGNSFFCQSSRGQTGFGCTQWAKLHLTKALHYRKMWFCGVLQVWREGHLTKVRDWKKKKRKNCWMFGLWVSTACNPSLCKLKQRHELRVVLVCTPSPCLCSRLQRVHSSWTDVPAESPHILLAAAPPPPSATASPAPRPSAPSAPASTKAIKSHALRANQTLSPWSCHLVRCTQHLVNLNFKRLKKKWLKHLGIGAS